MKFDKILRKTGGRAEFYFLMLLRCPFDALLTMLQARLLSSAFDAINVGDGDALRTTCLLTGLLGLMLFFYNGVVWSAFAAFTARTVGRLRGKLFEKITVLSLKQVEEKSKGDWITRLNQDAQLDIITKPIQLPHAAVAVVGLCVSSWMLYRLNSPIFALVIAFIIPHILFSRFFIARPMTKLAKKSREAAAKNTADLDAVITCADTAVLYDAQDFLMKKFEESSLSLLRTNMTMRRRNAAGSAVMPFFGMGAYLVLLYVSVRWIAAGTLTFGGLTAAFQYRGGILTGALMLINCIISIKASLAGIERVNEVFETE